MESKKKNINGLVGTIAFHAILLTILLLFSFTKPEPVHPEPYGITIEFGEEVIGIEDAGIETAQTENQENIQPTTPTNAASATEDIVTQDNTDAPTVNTSTKPQVEPTPKPTQEEIEAAKKAEELRQLQETLNSGNMTGTRGNSTTGSTTGIPGSPDGGNIPTNGIGSIGNPYGNDDATHLKRPMGTENCNKPIKLTVMIDALGNVTKVTKVETALSEQSCINAAKKVALEAKFPSNESITGPRYAEIVYKYTFSN